MKTTEIKIYKTRITANINSEIVQSVMLKHEYKELFVCFDKKCKLSKLNNDESVLWGDGDSFFFIIKK